MPYRGHNGLFCRGCGGHRDEVGGLSARYKCAECSERLALENLRGLSDPSSAAFQHWRRRMRAAFGIVALDDDERAA